MCVPILLCKFHTPEMRAWREELHSNSCPLIRSISHINDTAFLFFFGGGIHQHKLGAKIEFLLQIEESAVRIDYDGLAVFAKFAACVTLAFGLDRNAREDARATTLAAGFCLDRHMGLSCNAAGFESTIQPVRVSKSTVQKCC